jgi:putative ABC transport system ATP-binding protein
MVMTLLRRLVHERDVLAIVATHDPLMMELADHLVELRDGEVVGEERRAPSFSGEGEGPAAAAAPPRAG